MQCFLRQLGNGLQQRHGHLGANDRRDLHQAFSLRGRLSRRAASTASMVSGSGKAARLLCATAAQVNSSTKKGLPAALATIACCSDAGAARPVAQTSTTRLSG